jgi:hypothetical protein
MRKKLDTRFPAVRLNLRSCDRFEFMYPGSCAYLCADAWYVCLCYACGCLNFWLWSLLAISFPFPPHERFPYDFTGAVCFKLVVCMVVFRQTFCGSFRILQDFGWLVILRALVGWWFCEFAVDLSSRSVQSPVMFRSCFLPPAFLW